MPENSSDLLERARVAFQQGDRRTGSILINKILQRDLGHQDAWRLLHRESGSGQPFETFQREFVQKHYPDKVHLLDNLEPSSKKKRAKKEGKKPGLFARFRGSSRDRKQRRLSLLKDLPADRKKSSSLRESSSGTPSGTSTSRFPSVLPPIGERGSSLKSGERIKVLVVDDVSQTRDNLLRLLLLEPQIEAVGAARSGAEAIQLAIEKEPDVILMDINMPDIDGLEATRIIRSKVPFIQVVILTVQDDPSYMREALLAGARDFLVKPPVVDDLVDAVHQAYAIARDEKARMPPASTTPAGPGAGTLPSPSSKTTFQVAKIITVYSPKGGAGRTTLATNLAIALQRDDSQVIIVDGSLQFGGVGISFNKSGKNNVLDLTPRVAELDPDVIRDVVLIHEASSVHILAAPGKPEHAERVGADQFAGLLRYLSSLYAYVIVDTTPELTEQTLAVLKVSDLVILITTQDVPSLDKVRRFLELVPTIGLSKEKILFVMNQYHKKINITPERVSENFKKEFAAVIPIDYQVVTPSVNRGSPFMLDRKSRSRPVGKAVTQLVEVILKGVFHLS